MNTVSEHQYQKLKQSHCKYQELVLRWIYMEKHFTVDVVLFFWGHDRNQVTIVHPAVLLSHLPALPLCKVTVTEALELLPAQFTVLQV